MCIARKIYLFTSLTVCLSLLVACGFKPLYSTGNTQQASIQSHFDDIYISNIPDRTGQFLRNALIDRFYAGARPSEPEYNLVISPVNETVTNLDITKSSDATRAQLRFTTKMVLKEQETGKILLKRDLRAITSYNILQSQFTTRVSAENARENALTDVARQIEMQLGLYFSRGDKK